MQPVRLLVLPTLVYDIYSARKMHQVFLVSPLTGGAVVNVGKIYRTKNNIEI